MQENQDFYDVLFRNQPKIVEYDQTLPNSDL